MSSPTTWLPANSLVNTNKLDPRLKTFLERAGEAHWALFRSPLVVTSGNDSTHVAGSAHYWDKAIDLRSRDLSDSGALIMLIILVNLGLEFGVAVFDERLKPDGPHFHCEIL